MLREVIEYENFDGDKTQEVAYFHISKGEMIRFVSEGLISPVELEFIMKEKDYNKIYLTFEKFVRLSYGKRTEDGSRFIKDEEATKYFMNSPVYDAFFEKILSTAEEATRFANAIFPASLIKEATKAIEGAKKKSEPKEEFAYGFDPAWEKRSESKEETSNKDIAFEDAVEREVAKRLGNAKNKYYSGGAL